MRQLLWFAGSLAVVAACGVQLDGADNDEPSVRDAGNDANTGGRGDSGSPPPRPDAATPDPGNDAGPGSPDAGDPALDAGPADSGNDTPDARVPVCNDQAVSGRFCPTNDTATGALCANLANGNTGTVAVIGPTSMGGVGQATLGEPFDPDWGFTIEAKLRQHANQVASFAVLLGNAPAEGSFCDRINQSQAAVVFWRVERRVWTLQIVTACDQLTDFTPTAPNVEVSFDWRVELNGTELSASTSGNYDSSRPTVRRNVTLQGPLRASIALNQGQNSARIDEIDLSCGDPPD